MSVVNEVVRGALKVNTLPERQCFTSWQDFIQAIPDLLSVEVPTSISGVVVGKDQPDEDDRDKIWFRRDGNGTFLGTYAFQNGAWQLLYQFVPGQVIWTTGNSSDVPVGFTLIKAGDSTLPTNVVNAIISQYVPNGLGGFDYYALRFSGY